MNTTLQRELFPNQSPELLVTYNDAYNQAIATHLGGQLGEAGDIAAMSDPEFKLAVLGATRQPINPVTELCKMLDYPEDTPMLDIMHGVESAYDQLLGQYEEHNVDGRRVLRAAGNIIAHTEAYITGYANTIGTLAHMMVLIDPTLNGHQRWHEGLWVPQEDEHDRLRTYTLVGMGEQDMHAYHREHTRHMVIGMHVATADPVETTFYVMQQEPFTVPSYNNEAKLLGSVLSHNSLRIAKDEAPHARGYRGIGKVVIMAHPDETLPALRRQFEQFGGMPGRDGIEDFDDKTKITGLAGVLDPYIILKIQRDLIKTIGVAEAEVTTDEAKEARDVLLDPNGAFGERQLAKRKRQMEMLRHRAVETARKDNRPLPAIIGVTVESDKFTHELSFPEAA